MHLALTEQDLDVELLQYLHLVTIHYLCFHLRIIKFPDEVGEAKWNPGFDAESFYEIKAMAPQCVCTEICHMHKNKGKCYFNHKLEAENKANKNVTWDASRESGMRYHHSCIPY